MKWLETWGSPSQPVEPCIGLCAVHTARDHKNSAPYQVSSLLLQTHMVWRGCVGGCIPENKSTAGAVPTVHVLQPRGQASLAHQHATTAVYPPAARPVAYPLRSPAVTCCDLLPGLVIGLHVCPNPSAPLSFLAESLCARRGSTQFTILARFCHFAAVRCPPPHLQLPHGLRVVVQHREQLALGPLVQLHLSYGTARHDAVR